MRAFAEEMNRLNRQRRAQGEHDRKVLDKIEKAIAGIIAAIEDGMYQPSMKARMDELERQKAEIIARQSKAPSDTPDVHPNIASIYRRRVERFTDALHNDEDGRIAAEELRSLIEEVVLMPGDKRGEVHARLRGELFGILDFVEAEHRQRPGEVRTKVEASPATIFTCDPPSPPAGFFVCAEIVRIPARSPWTSISILPSTGVSTILSTSERRMSAASIRFSSSSSCKAS